MQLASYHSTAQCMVKHKVLSPSRCLQVVPFLLLIFTFLNSITCFQNNSLAGAGTSDGSSLCLMAPRSRIAELQTFNGLRLRVLTVEPLRAHNSYIIDSLWNHSENIHRITKFVEGHFQRFFFFRRNFISLLSYHGRGSGTVHYVVIS